MKEVPKRNGAGMIAYTAGTLP